jgi:hypothetical protein
LEVSWIFGLPSGYVNIAIENGVEIVVVFPLKAWWIFPVRETLTRGDPNNQITGFLWISMDFYGWKLGMIEIHRNPPSSERGTPPHPPRLLKAGAVRRSGALASDNICPMP